MDAQALHRPHTKVELHADLLIRLLTSTPRRLGALAPRRPLAGVARPTVVFHDGPQAGTSSRHQNTKAPGRIASCQAMRPYSISVCHLPGVHPIHQAMLLTRRTLSPGFPIG